MGNIRIPARWIGPLIVLIFLLVAPSFLQEFRLNLLGKFITFAIAALAIDLMWGYGGMLSLGQGVFFGLGAYAMAMCLKLESSGGKLPDFMSWSSLDSLPWFWVPFENPLFAIAMALIIPAALAGVLGYMVFRSRISGVYFSIITQALALIMTTLFVGQQAYTGGTNGITNLSTLFGLSRTSQTVQIGLYFVSVVVLVLVYVLCDWLTRSRFGQMLVAMRDNEQRVRFSGMDPAVIKTLVFVLAAALTGLAGALYLPQEGNIAPARMAIVPSIGMVIWVAVGGRGTLIGAVIGALVVSAAERTLSENFAEIWMYLLGALFIGVVLLFPRGLVGIVQDGWQAWQQRRTKPVVAVPEATSMEHGS